MPDIKFSCPKCKGRLVVDEGGAGEQITCPTCGAPIIIPLQISVSEQKAFDPAAHIPASMPAPMSPIIQKTSDMAVWSIILGILSFVACCFPLGIPAIICGHIARSRIRKANGSLKGEGMALAGLILGYFSFISTFALYVGGKALDQASKIEETKTNITYFDSSISAYKLFHRGKVPNSMNEAFPITSLNLFSKDGFGNDFVYTPNHANETYKLVSPGPDGKIGTEDDISNKE